MANWNKKKLKKKSLLIKFFLSWTLEVSYLNWKHVKTLMFKLISENAAFSKHQLYFNLYLWIRKTSVTIATWNIQSQIVSQMLLHRKH